MKFILFSFFLILSTLSVLGQVSFDKGYFITNNNQRVECYIKNTDWGDTPKDFRYKLTETGETLKGEISDTREFGIRQNPAEQLPGHCRSSRFCYYRAK